MDGAIKSLSVKCKKTAAAQRGSRLPRHQAVALPDGSLPLQDAQYVVSAFGLPPPDVFLRHVGCEIGQAAAAAAHALHGFCVFHLAASPARKIPPARTFVNSFLEFQKKYG